MEVKRLKRLKLLDFVYFYCCWYFRWLRLILILCFRHLWQQQNERPSLFYLHQLCCEKQNRKEQKQIQQQRRMCDSFNMYLYFCQCFYKNTSGKCMCAWMDINASDNWLISFPHIDGENSRTLELWFLRNLPTLQLSLVSTFRVRDRSNIGHLLWSQLFFAFSKRCVQ